jgi:hypothetical protein
MSSKAGDPEIRLWSESAEKSELTLPSIGRGNQSLLSFRGTKTDLEPIRRV